MTEAVGPDTSVGVAARELLADAMLDVVRRLRALVRKGPRKAKRVHSFRVATRRASAALRFFEGLIECDEAERTARRLRRFRRRTGAVRRGDVHLAMLRSGLQGRVDPDSQEVRRLIADTKRLRSSDRKALRKCLTPREVRRMRRVADRVVSAVCSNSVSLGATAAGWIGESVPRALEAGDSAASDRGAFHGARIEFKRLRYSVELLRSCYAAATMDAVLLWLADVQDRMGAVNDLDEMVAALSPDQPPGDAALSEVQQTLRNECDRAYAGFAEWWRTSGRAECGRVFRPICSATGVVDPERSAGLPARTLVPASGAPGEMVRP